MANWDETCSQARSNKPEPNRWLVVGVNTHTGNREIIAVSAQRDTAKCHKIDLENELPRRYAGVTIEYGRQSEWEAM